jgi:N6-adenosine-specific RNA methylase IME4
MGRGLIKWDALSYQIANCTDIKKLSAIRNRLTAYKVLARQSKESMKTQNKIVDYRLRVDRKLGQWSKGLEGKPGKRADLTSGIDAGGSKSKRDYYKEINITEREMFRKEQIAEIPEEIFEQHIQTTKRKKLELTTKSVLQLAQRLSREKAREENKKQIELHQPREPIENYFKTIVVDPPWDVSEMGDNEPFGRSEPGYASMTIAEIEAEDIGKYAAENCHLYLWGINRMLFKALPVLEAWGFRYVTLLTWCKPSIKMGNYFRNNTEQILFGVKGSLTLLRNDVGTWFNAPPGSGGHSSKPNQFYELIQSCSPGPRLDYFARNERQGWETFGVEI